MDITVHTGSTKVPSGTSLVSLAFRSPDGEQACLLLHFSAPPRDAKTFEDEAAAIIQHSLLESEGEPWHRLDGVLKELNGLLKGLVLSKTIDDIHAVVALVEAGGTLHVSHAGRGEAYLIRDGGASQITEFSKGKPTAAFIHISSGPLEPGDSVVFSTQRLLRSVTPAQLSSLTLKGDQFLPAIVASLESEREAAALGFLRLSGPGAVPAATRSSAVPSRRSSRRSASGWADRLSSLSALSSRLIPLTGSLLRAGSAGVRHASKGAGTLSGRVQEFLGDLRHPQRKRRAHLLLLAGAGGVFLVVWLLVSLSTAGQKSKTRAELSQLVAQIESGIKSAENSRTAGEMDMANEILERAEGQAKQVMNNTSELFRAEALSLLERIRRAREEINNVVRLTPRVLADVSSKNPDVAAHGIIGIGDGEFIVYDRQDTYRILLGKLDDPKRVVEDELILQGAAFPRYKSQVFLTTGNSVIEMSGNQLTSMKTEDPDGWIVGKDAETYLRYLYILSPEKKQIYKYERLQNRYGPPAPYNVNGDLAGALDMTIDTSIYVLKEGGVILKLMRGEVQPAFKVRLADKTDNLETATKMFKVAGGNMYVLDPAKKRVVILSDAGASGEAVYVKQYVLQGEDLTALQDLYVDAEQNHLYVTDEKRVYEIDLEAR